MKKYLFALPLLVSFAFAQQPKVVPLTDTEKQTIDLAQTKLQNIQLQATQLQNDATNKLKDYGEQYQAQQKALNDAIAAARKFHNLDDTAAFDGTKFQFTIYPKVEKKDDKK
jgi:hypothetical protein